MGKEKDREVSCRLTERFLSGLLLFKGIEQRSLVPGALVGYPVLHNSDKSFGQDFVRMNCRVNDVGAFNSYFLEILRDTCRGVGQFHRY